MMRRAGLLLAACAIAAAVGAPLARAATIVVAQADPSPMLGPEASPKAIRVARRRRPTPSPKPTPPPIPTPEPTPSPTSTPTPAPTPTPTETPNPHPVRYRGQIIAPPPTPLLLVPGMPAPAVTPARPGLATPLPAAPPTAQSLPPDQPTVPESANDPAVQDLTLRPVRELSQISWMAGTWKAHSVEHINNGKSRDHGVTTYVFGLTMRGRWLFGADGRARDYFYLTFDPFARHWVMLRFEDKPSYGFWVSGAGWRGNRIEFTSVYSVVNGRQYQRRLTIVHKDARAFGIYDEEQLPGGSWARDDSVELTRQR